MRTVTQAQIDRAAAYVATLPASQVPKPKRLKVPVTFFRKILVHFLER